MRRHQREVPLLSIVARLGWRADPASSVAKCRDHQWRDSAVVIRLGNGCVTMECGAFGALHFSPLQVGRLRAALKAAALDLVSHTPAAPAVPAPRAPAVTPAPKRVPRRRAVWVHESRPFTVADLVEHMRVRALVSPEAPRLP